MNAESLAARGFATALDAVVLIGLAVALELARVKLCARFAGGPVAPWVQPLRDLTRLMRKQRIRPEFASPLHGVWPLAAAAAMLTLALLVPGFATYQITAPFATVPLVIGLLAASRTARVLAALDAGAGDEGHAAARAAYAGIRTDVVWLFAFAALALAGGELPLDVSGRTPDALVAGLAVLGVLLAREGEPAVPGDYAGPDRAIFMAEAMLRRTLLLVLLIDLAAPAGLADAASPLSWPLGLMALVVKFGAAALVLGFTALVLRRGAPSVGFASVLAALAVALLQPVPAASLGLAGGVALMVWGLARLWRRQPAIEAAVLVQGGVAFVGFGLGSLRAGAIILIGLALGRLAAALAGRGVFGLFCLVALAGLPPFGLFAGDFLVIGAARNVSTILAAGLLAGLALAAVLLVGRGRPAHGIVTIAPGRAVAAALLLVLLVAIGAAPVAALLP